MSKITMNTKTLPVSFGLWLALMTCALLYTVNSVVGFPAKRDDQIMATTSFPSTKVYPSLNPPHLLTSPDISSLTHSDKLINAEGTCPSILIFEPNYKNISTCFSNGCCLPCPYINNFYKTNQLDMTYKLFSALGIVSFFLMLLLALTFYVLPSSKKNPTTKQILLPFVFAVCFFSFADFFTIQQQESQCQTDILPATVRNNALCAAQAFFELGGAYAIACWSALLIVHLHLLSVWRSEFIMRNIVTFNVIIWFGTFLAAAIPMITGQVTSSNICFVSQSAKEGFFYPLSFIYVVFGLHLWTCAYMANVTIRTNWRKETEAETAAHLSAGKASLSDAQRTLVHVRTILKLQWRALLGALLMTAIYVTDFIYFVVLFPEPVSTSSQWVKDWYKCLTRPDGDQDTCASVSDGQFPNYPFTVYVLFINRCAGILIFIIFAAKKSVFVEWYELIAGKPIDKNKAADFSVVVNRPTSRRQSDPSVKAKLRPTGLRPKKYKRKSKRSFATRSFATISAVTAATIPEDEEPEEPVGTSRLSSQEFNLNDGDVQRLSKIPSLSTVSSTDRTFSSVDQTFCDTDQTLDNTDQTFGSTDQTPETEEILRYLTPPPRAFQERRSITEFSVYASSSLPQTPLDTPPQSRKVSVSSSIIASHSPTTSLNVRLSISSIDRNVPKSTTSSYHSIQEDDRSSLSPQLAPSIPRASFGVTDSPSSTYDVHKKKHMSFAGVEEKHASYLTYEERRISLPGVISQRSTKTSSPLRETIGESNRKHNGGDLVKLQQSIVIDPGITLTFDPMSKDDMQGDASDGTRTMTFGAEEEHAKWVDNYFMNSSIIDPSISSDDAMEAMTNTSRAQSPTSTTDGRRLSRKNNSDESLVIPISDLYDDVISTSDDQTDESRMSAGTIETDEE